MAAVLFGGAGGAFITHWFATQTTVIEYGIGKTALGADQTAVIPDFKVGGTTVQTLFIYSIRLQYGSGPELEGARVGIELQNPSVKSFGKIVADGPSQVFHINCEQFAAHVKSSGTLCSMGRLNSNVGAYTVSFATDTDAPISLYIDAKNAVMKEGISGPAKSDTSRFTLVLTALAAGLMGLAFTSRLRFDPPKLTIDYEGAAGNKVEVHRTLDQNKTEIFEIYIRVRVRNLSSQTAKNVRVFLTSLREVNNGQPTRPVISDSLQLKWAGWGAEPRDVPSQVSFYADVIVISKNTAGWNFATKEQFASMSNLAKYSGTYRFEVTATAENASHAKCEVDITYRQDWNTLRAEAIQA